jgi:phage-related holin
MKNYAILILVFIIVCLNILLPHVTLEVGSNQRTTFIYFILNEVYTPEMFFSLTAFYPLTVAILVLFLKKVVVSPLGRIFVFFWGGVGILFTILLWLTMNLHLDVKIVSYNISYYSTLVSQIVSSLVCLLFPVVARRFS